MVATYIIYSQLGRAGVGRSRRHWNRCLALCQLISVARPGNGLFEGWSFLIFLVMYTCREYAVIKYRIMRKVISLLITTVFIMQACSSKSRRSVIEQSDHDAEAVDDIGVDALKLLEIV
jgi:hypothetical protein